MTTEQIIETTCVIFKITRTELISKTRTRELADARSIIAYLLISRNLEYKDGIGRILCKDRTSIYNMIKKFKNNYSVDKLFKSKVLYIIKLLDDSDHCI